MNATTFKSMIKLYDLDKQLHSLERFQLIL